tara:strand:+ start:113 stop:427 length:315 start_codon:yes stop_codon:yes gene_type:complete
MKKDPILYFGLDSNERLAVPASKFLGIDPGGSHSLQVSFKDTDATADGAVIVMNIDTSSTLKEACKVLAGALYGQSRGLTVVADTENGNFMYPFISVTSITSAL